MRTLTQVWFIHASIAFVFLLVCFQLMGRTGLLIALLLILAFLYATLRKSLFFIWDHLKTEKLTGHDTTGLLQAVEQRKAEFGFKQISIFLTSKPTPPLVWKNTETNGCIILNRELLENLSLAEIKLLAVFTLSHLQCRSFVLPQFLSSLRWPIWVLALIPQLLAIILNKVMQKQGEIFKADLKFMTCAGGRVYESGYFLNRLHQFSFHQTKKAAHYYYFSTLSMKHPFQNEEFGLPYLRVRLNRLMGFSIS